MSVGTCWHLVVDSGTSLEVLQVLEFFTTSTEGGCRKIKPYVIITKWVVPLYQTPLLLLHVQLREQNQGVFYGNGIVQNLKMALIVSAGTSSLIWYSCS